MLSLMRCSAAIVPNDVWGGTGSTRSYRAVGRGAVPNDLAGRRFVIARSGEQEGQEVAERASDDEGQLGRGVAKLVLDGSQSLPCRRMANPLRALTPPAGLNARAGMGVVEHNSWATRRRSAVHPQDGA
jgi:hypothetical protein